MTTVDCFACGYPVYAKSEDDVLVCRPCGMIAKGLVYADGSDPAANMSRHEQLHITLRVLQHRQLSWQHHREQEPQPA